MYVYVYVCCMHVDRICPFPRGVACNLIGESRPSLACEFEETRIPSKRVFLCVQVHSRPSYDQLTRSKRSGEGGNECRSVLAVLSVARLHAAAPLGTSCLVLVVVIRVIVC